MISPALQAAFDDGVFVAVEEPVWHSKIDIDGTFVYKKGTKKLVGRMQSINQWSIMATCKFHTCTKCICWVSIPKRFQTEDRKSDLQDALSAWLACGGDVLPAEHADSARQVKCDFGMRV